MTQAAQMTTCTTDEAVKYILIIEDDGDVLEMLTFIGGQSVPTGFQLLFADNLETAEGLFFKHRKEIVAVLVDGIVFEKPTTSTDTLLGITRPTTVGGPSNTINLVRLMRQVSPGVVILAGASSPEHRELQIQAGANIGLTQKERIFSFLRNIMVIE